MPCRVQIALKMVRSASNSTESDEGKENAINDEHTPQGAGDDGEESMSVTVEADDLMVKRMGTCARFETLRLLVSEERQPACGTGIRWAGALHQRQAVRQDPHRRDHGAGMDIHGWRHTVCRGSTDRGGRREGASMPSRECPYPR